MEIALFSSSILHAPSFSDKLSYGDKNRFYRYSATPKNNFNILPLYHCAPIFPEKFCASLGFLLLACHPASTTRKHLKGVLMDAYRAGNRQSFNSAFQKLGLDCANWSVSVYADLLRRSTGDEEKMLLLYFNRIGWLTSLPTNEKGEFIKNVLQEKEKALEEFVISSLPLRPGLEDFIDDAYKEGIQVVILTAYNKSDDDIAREIMAKLGNDQSSKVTIVGSKEVEQSLYGQLVLRKILSSGLDEQFAKEAKRAVSAEKQRMAKEVASLLKLSVEIDTSLSESSYNLMINWNNNNNVVTDLSGLDKIVAALRVGAQYVGLPVCNCIPIEGSQSGVTGAQQVGMPCVVLRSSLTSRAELPSAYAIVDGFGGADLSISKLRRLHKKKQP